MNDKNERGAWGEDRAVLYLRLHGYRILERNFRCRQGEIDVIARRGETVAFVEVKLRKNAEHGEAREFVTRAQLESPMSALLLTDSKGQHKDNKRKAQKALVEDVVFEEVGAVEKPAKARAMEDIWDRL